MKPRITNELGGYVVRWPFIGYAPFHNYGFGPFATLRDVGRNWRPMQDNIAARLRYADMIRQR